MKPRLISGMAAKETIAPMSGTTLTSRMASDDRPNNPAKASGRRRKA
jgi:hypothetical protein